jgi:yecA family protein
VDFSLFLVDLFCLGVKDVIVETDVLESDLRTLVDEQLPEDFRERLHPACAKKLIDGALAYAESLGFAPYRDFRKARKILSGLDAALCPRDYTYGRAGRPCYIRGADDTDDRVDRVLAVLDAKCGDEGYDFEDPSIDEEDAVEAVRTELLEFLETEPIGVPRFYELSGLLTAMLICPGVLSPLKALDAIWEAEDRVWESKEEAEDFIHLLMIYWNFLNDVVTQASAPDAHPDERIMDLWEEDFEDQKVDDDVRGLAMTMATFAWAKGFRRATELWPEAWGNALTRPDLAPHWEVVNWWANFEVKENRDVMMAAAESATPRTLNPSVKALARALRPAAGTSPAN